MDNKIYNKQSKRWVTKNGNQYNKLLRSGWNVNNQNQLSPPKNSVSSSISSSIPSPINNNLFNDVLSTQLVSYLSPNDLLSLYLSSKENQTMLNSNQILNILNNKYGTNATSFVLWYKSYISSLIPNNKQYLYDLEAFSYIDNDYLDDLYNGVGFNRNTYLILYDWIYTICIMLHIKLYIVSYWSTLFLVFASTYKKLKKEDAQLYGCVVLQYCLVLFEEYPAEDSTFITVTDNAFDEKQFENARRVVLDSVGGILIYPSPVLFLDTSNNHLMMLTMIASLSLRTMKYKASLIAEACTFLLTNTYNNFYSIQEISFICKNIQSSLKNISGSNLSSLKTTANVLLPMINKIDTNDTKKSVMSPLKFHEPWHIGQFDRLALLGEGTYGKVNKIQLKACGTQYAIKSSEFDPSSTSEIAILNLLKHENRIITLCGFKQKKSMFGDKLEIILPIYDTDLQHIQHIIPNKNYSVLFKQILEAVNACHRYDILHRDIKDNNFLIRGENGNVEVVLIDFGLSVPFQSIRKPNDNSLANSLSFRPPECLLGTYLGTGDVYSFEIDIWAVGCLFYYLLLDKYIVDVDVSDSESYLLDSIFTLLGTPTPDDWPNVPKREFKNFDYHTSLIPELKKELAPYGDLVLDCLQLSPQKRPSAKQLLQKYF